MFGLSTELITKGKLATVKRFDNKAFTLVITRSYRKREQETLIEDPYTDHYC